MNQGCYWGQRVFIKHRWTRKKNLCHCILAGVVFPLGWNNLQDMELQSKWILEKSMIKVLVSYNENMIVIYSTLSDYVIWTIHRGIYYSCKLYNSYNICILCNVQQQLTTIRSGGREKLLGVSFLGKRQRREQLSVLQVTMYNDVWQRGDSSNAPIRKIICRTNYVEKKIKNKLNPLKK